MGLGKATVIETLEIFWPTTGKSQRFLNVPADQFIQIAEGETEYRKLPWKSVKFRR
jgi:hypothetical protein